MTAVLLVIAAYCLGKILEACFYRPDPDPFEPLPSEICSKHGERKETDGRCASCHQEQYARWEEEGLIPKWNPPPQRKRDRPKRSYRRSTN